MAYRTSETPSAGFFAGLLAWPPLAGLAACAGLALAAMGLWQLLGRPALFGPMVLALMGGMVLRNAFSLPDGVRPGARLAMKPVLRAGIVLLGLRLSMADLAAVGPAMLAVIAAILFGTFFAMRRVGAMLGVDAKLAELIAAGTSVCGASAVMGVNTVTRGRDEDVAYAIACVTLFGSLSMLLFPLLMPVLGFGEVQFGLWAGASLHEVAQAVGAGFSVSEAAGESATIAKLSRVLLLAPLILGLVFARRGGGSGAGDGTGAPVPWFVLGFLGVAALNSVVDVPDAVRSGLLEVSAFLLTMALGAMGLETRLGQLRQKGIRPLLLGAIGWIGISAAAAAGVMLAA